MNRKFLRFIILQVFILFGLIWFIAGNDRLFRSTVPIEQRLVSANESIRKKAQQELLGLDAEAKKRAATRLMPALEQEDAFVRKWAAISLALAGPPAREAIPLLLQSVSAKEKDVAQAARVALSEIGAPDAQQLPSLLRTIQDPREAVRCEAALSIGKMGPAAQEAVPLLTGYLSRPTPTPACFEDALASLAASLPAAVGPVLELLTSGRPDIRLKAAHVLSQVSIKEAAFIAPVLRAMANETNPEIRKQLMKALSIPENDAEGRGNLWTAALRTSQNETVRLSAVDFLRQMANPPSGLDDIWKEGLGDPSAPVRLAVAQWIRESAVRGSKPLPLILRMLKDPEPTIRRLGLETLRRSGIRSSLVMQRVAKAQRDPDAGVRCRASQALIEAGSIDRISVALLISDLKKDEDTARCAEDALGLAGFFEADVLRSMIRLVQDEKDPDIRSRAARVLMHLGPRAQEAIPVLIRAQKDEVPGAEMALRAIRLPATRKRR